MSSSSSKSERDFIPFGFHFLYFQGQRSEAKRMIFMKRSVAMGNLPAIFIPHLCRTLILTYIFERYRREACSLYYGHAGHGSLGCRRHNVHRTGLSYSSSCRKRAQLVTHIVAERWEAKALLVLRLLLAFSQSSAGRRSAVSSFILQASSLRTCSSQAAGNTLRLDNPFYRLLQLCQTSQFNQTYRLVFVVLQANQTLAICRAERSMRICQLMPALLVLLLVGCIAGTSAIVLLLWSFSRLANV